LKNETENPSAERAFAAVTAWETGYHQPCERPDYLDELLLDVDGHLPEKMYLNCAGPNNGRSAKDYSIYSMKAVV
jgi:hypothetical protein